MTLQVEFVSSLESISQQQWQALCANSGPFLDYRFLVALEQSSSIGHDTGWMPLHGLIYRNNQLIGALPCYIKHHSYGEYVFDFAWANAYHQHGLDYYPKLVCAIPFTPVGGNRLLLSDNSAWCQDDWVCLLDALRSQLSHLGGSSIHWLFPTTELSKQLTQYQHLQRKSVQFHWFNHNYASFDDFLQNFTSRKRKNVLKERNRVHGSGIQITRLTGDVITAEDMAFFYQCYRQTYLKRSGHDGYLTEAFFTQLLATMPEHLLIVKASMDGNGLASALYLYDRQQLSGRYWGTLTEVDYLHFELCYYQGIEFCIEQNIPRFNPGTQGEHKIARGFTPVYCYSNHWLAHPQFHAAVDDFLQREASHIAEYLAETTALLPFKQLTD